MINRAAVSCGRFFPSAEEVLALPDAAFGMPVARRETICGRWRGRSPTASCDLDAGRRTGRRPCGGCIALPGIGAVDRQLPGHARPRRPGRRSCPPTSAVRRGAAALGLPDDPTALDAYAERWRPWRSYAVIRLWRAA